MSASRSLVDPDLLPFLDAWPSLDYTMEGLDGVRAWSAAEMVPPEDLVGVSRYDKIVHRDSAPDLRLTIYAPTDALGPWPCIYHVHGGGFVGGSVAASEPFNLDLCADLKCAIVTSHFRLAPETPFPGPLEDCYAGLKWLFGHADEVGVDKERIGLLGASAGGCLAAGLALLARDRDEFKPAFLNLTYPALDDRTCVDADPHPHAGEFVWLPAFNSFGWKSYLAAEPGSGDISPYAAPARAERLEDLPPTYISVGALDLFVDEDLEFARRLGRAGVPVELQLYPGAYHAFDAAPDAPVAVRARKDRHDALRRAMKLSSSG